MNTILITGGSSGLGFHLAKIYSQHNQVIIVGRSKEKLLKAESLLNNNNISIYPCDITRSSDLKSLTNYLSHQKIRIHTLINNAGIGHFGPLESLEESQLDAMLDINVKGTIMTTKHLLAYTKEKIINIISTAGLRGKVHEAAYVASKFAVRGFTESIQKEYKGRLKITAVYMGGMNTPFWHQSDHIKDKSRLKSPQTVAEIIYQHDDGREKIIID